MERGTFQGKKIIVVNTDQTLAVLYNNIWLAYTESVEWKKYNYIYAII